MYTSLAFLAFTHLLAVPSSPSWANDYWRALKQGQLEQKPLAVFVGSGQEGYRSVARERNLPGSVQSLARNYVWVYLDTTTPGGQELARDLNITKGTGLVISDRTGTLQALHHDGDLAVADLERHLERFADPGFVVQTTESNVRTSYYPQQSYRQPVGRSC